MQSYVAYNDVKTGARAFNIATCHGVIETPIFMPVGTIGTVKGVFPEQLKEDVDARIILGNTYHLYLRPGCRVIEKAGGLHKFINWSSPILTDSGGYQVYSLSTTRKVKEEGVKFKSHIDGSIHWFTPENAVKFQRSIGADIIMCLDECVAHPVIKKYARIAMERTHRWIDRGLCEFNESKPIYEYSQTFVPIVQGGVFADLRVESAEFVAQKELPINAIGGLSVGEPHDLMYEMTELVCSNLPKDKPRYLMGVGTPANILECISLGVDMFDCVMPTRNGRNGMLFTVDGIINIKNRKWTEDFSPIDVGNYSFVDLNYSKAYLRHLFTVNEMLGKQIASLHNLAFYVWLVKEAREKIVNGTFGHWKKLMIPKLSQRL